MFLEIVLLNCLANTFFSVLDMELSFISKPKRYENKTVTPVVEQYIDTVDANLTNSTEFTLLDQNYSDLSNDVSLENSASRILSQLNNGAITNEFNSNMKSWKKNLEDEQKKKIEKEKLLEAIKLKRIQKEKLLEERKLEKIQKEKLEEERKLKKIQNETLGNKTPNGKGKWIVKLEKIPIKKGEVIWVKKFGSEEKVKKSANKSYPDHSKEKKTNTLSLNKNHSVLSKNKKTNTQLENKIYSDHSNDKKTNTLSVNKSYSDNSKDRKTNTLLVNKSYLDHSKDKKTNILLVNTSYSGKVSSKVFQCSYCDSKYSQKHNLKTHIKKFHDKNELKVESYNAIELGQMCHIDDQKMAEETKLNDGPLKDSASQIPTQLNSSISLKYVRKNKEMNKKTNALLANKSYSDLSKEIFQSSLDDSTSYTPSQLNTPIPLKYGRKNKEIIKKIITLSPNKSYSDHSSDGSLEDSASSILSQLNSPIPLKYVRKNKENYKKSNTLSVNKSYSDHSNDGSLENSASYILSQLNSPIPMKYISMNEEKNVINTPSEKGYGVENFQKGKNEVNGTLIHKGSIHKGSEPEKFRVEENYMDISPSGKGYSAEEFEKRKKEINKDCIDKGKKIGKFGGGEKEYFDLPYGWTKEVVYLRNQPSMKGKTRQDIYLISPGSNGKKFKSDIKLQKFLEENPNIKCDLAVTSTKKTVHTEFLMNRTFGQ